MKRHIIVLDTNIYRQLGLRFYEHVDYTSLQDYCYSSGSEMLISQTVETEYLNYYRAEIIDINTQTIEKSFSKLKKLEYFQHMKKPFFRQQTAWQMRLIRTKLTKHLLKNDPPIFVEASDLTEFLIHNRNEGIKKDHTRDYLIWTSVMQAAKRYKENVVVLISEDAIFRQHQHFQTMLRKNKIRNVMTESSISKFLHKYGFQPENLDKHKILEKIPLPVIRRQLLRNKDAVPSYISYFYYHSLETFSLDEFSIGDMEVDSYYAHREGDLVKIIAHVLVNVYMVFRPEPDKEGLKKYLAQDRSGLRPHLETFDKNGRPIYDEKVLFHFMLTYEEATGQITKVKFLDLFFDNYQFHRIKRLFPDGDIRLE